MKVCTRCNKEKEDLEFQKRKASTDGFTSACKLCLKKYDDSRLKNPKRMKMRRDYQKTQKGKSAHSKACKNWVEKNQIKRGAHVLVGNAIRKGELIAKPCEVCKSTVVHAHHDDYAKPLTVRWLCDFHHNEWHRFNGEGDNAD